VEDRARRLHERRWQSEEAVLESVEAEPSTSGGGCCLFTTSGRSVGSGEETAMIGIRGLENPFG
jgi:hypothetical protein